MKTRHLVFKWLMVIVLLAGLTQAFSPSIVSGQTPGDRGKACTTVIVGKQASADGSVLMAHEEDYAPNDAMKVVHHPRQIHKPGEVIHFAFESVPQVPLTYAYTADEMYAPERLGMPPASFMNGINEWGVAMDSNCIDAQEPILSEENDMGLGWPEIGQLVMERAKTAKEGIDLAASLVDEYTFNGFEVSSCKHLAFLVSDPNEGWVIEVTRRHWVAQRVPDDGAVYYANECRIGADYDMASDDLIDYAVAQGWYVPGPVPFNFKDVYCGPFLGQEWNTKRQERAEFLVKPKLGTVTVQDLMATMRDHYEGTADYAIPYTGGYDGPTVVPICNSSNHASEVYHLRSWLPREIGPVMFITAASPDMSIYNPIYAGYAGQTPVEWRTATDSFAPDSAWWNFEYIQRTVASHHPLPDAAFYAAKFPHIRASFDRVEQQQFREMVKLEKTAAQFIAKGKVDQAKKLISTFSNSSLHQNYVRAKTMLHWLFAKGGVPGEE
jgi:dipeptidase